MQKAFLVDGSICLGCNTCAMACKNQYHQDKGILWRKVREIGAEEYHIDNNNILPTLVSYQKAPKAEMPMERFDQGSAMFLAGTDAGYSARAAHAGNVHRLLCQAA